MATKDLINTGPIYTRASTGEVYTPRNSSPVIEGDPINIRRYPGFDYDPYQENLPEGMSIEETQDFGGPEYAQGEFQSGWEQAAYTIPRIGVKVASEVSKLPGYLGGLAVWGAPEAIGGGGFKAKNISDMVDNEWIQAIDSAEQSVKERALPIFKTYKESTGSFSEQVFNPAFWATEGADGVGFFLSMLVPGQVLKALKVGEGLAAGIGTTAKLMKPGTKLATLAEKATVGANTAKYINGGLSATVNTLYESGAEAGEGYKNIIEQLSHDIDPYTGEDRGPKLNPDTGERYTEDEIKMVAGTNAANIMKSNMGLLLASNLIMEQLLFSSFDNSYSLKKAISGGITKEGEKLSLKTARPTLLQKIGRGATAVGTGVISEGLFEEGAQAAVQDYFTARATGEEPEPSDYSGVLGGIINTYVDNFSNSIDAQKAMFLGAVLGGGMGAIGSYSRNKQLEKQLLGSKASNPNAVQSFFGAKAKPETEGLINLLEGNLTNRYNDIISLAEKDGENYKYNPDGSIKFDKNKVAEYIQDKVKNKLTIDSMAVAHAAGQKEIYNYLKEINDFNYMLPFLTQEEGLSALNEHINDLSKLDAERQIQFLGKDKAQSSEKIKEQLLEKAARYEKVVKRLNQHHINSNLYGNLNYGKENKSHVDRFIARVLAGKQQSYFNQSFIPKEISRLQAENSGLNETLAAEKEQKDANDKYIERYTKALETANKNWNNLIDTKYLQKELDGFLAQQKEFEKTVEEITKNIAKQASNPAHEFTNKIYNEVSLADTYFDPESNRERSITHQGTIKVTLKDKDGNDAPFTEVINGISEEVDLKYKVDELLKSGNLKVSRIKSDGTKTTTQISPDGTILIGGVKTPFSYKVLETGEQAKLNNENRAAQEAYVNNINQYQKLLDDTVTRIAFIEERIQILEKRIQESINNEYTKSGKLKKFRLKSKSGKAVYMDALEMSVQLTKLKERNKFLSDKADTYSKLVERLKYELEGMRNTDENNIKLIQEAIELFKSSLDASYNTYMNTRDLIASKEKYLRMLFSRFKGFHTAFFNTFDDQFTRIINELRKESFVNNLSTERNKKLEFKLNRSRESLIKLSTQLYNQNLIEQEEKNIPDVLFRFRDEIKKSYNDIINSNLSTEEQDKQISELISDVKQAITEFFSDEDAALMNQAFDKQIEGIVDTIEITEKELQQLYAQKNEANKLYQDSKKNRAYHLELANRIFAHYNVIFKDQLDREFDVDDDQKKVTESIEPELAEIITKPEEELKEDESFEKIPLHQFLGSGRDFLHSAGKYGIDNSDEYFRWTGYVYTTKDLPTGEAAVNIIKTFTYDQIKALEPTNPIRQQIKFFDGVSEKTMEEISKSGPNEVVLNDIKIVVVKANNTAQPYMVSESGQSNKDSKYILFSQLPLPEYVRASGYDVFSYKYKLESIEKYLRLQKVDEKDLSILAKKELDKYLKQELNDYNEFRDKAKKGSQFLKIAGRNPGYRVETEEWNDISEVSFDYLDPKNFEVAKTDGSKNTTITVNGSKTPAKNGFTYLISQNSARLITPKTLDQTGEIEQVVDLIKWLMQNPDAENWTSVEKFVKQLTFFPYTTDINFSSFQYRLFLTKPKNKKGDSIPGVRHIIFGENQYSKEEFLENKEAVDKFREFLKTKYHNFDSESLKADEDYIEYTIKKGVLTPIKHTKAKGGYRHYLFGGSVSMGLVNLNKADKDPVTYARNPQYLNSSLSFMEYKVLKTRESSSSTKEEFITPIDETEDGGEKIERTETVTASQAPEGSVMWFIKTKGMKLKEAKIASDEWKSKQEPKESKQPKQSEETPSANNISEAIAVGAPDTLFSNDAVRTAWDNNEETRATWNNDFEAYKSHMLEDPFRLARQDSDYALGDINKQKAWLNEKFPDLPVFIYNGLIEGKAWGQFKRNLSFGLSKLSEVGTEYHEGYHAVSMLFTKQEERLVLYNELRSRLKGKYTDAQAEEILAEEFREFMLTVDNGGVYRFGENQKLQKTLFYRILNLLKQFITNLFGVEYSDNIIEKFKEIQHTQYNITDAKVDGIIEDDIDIPGKFTLSYESINRKKYCK